ncbi:hypothetical protein [Candidatus Methanodesulfokora washburnensis]|uniref:hypothetical protein n=1 Tax=Candidatus Methanodesulfokora washburnensis TaxID=2478471 RepID=UPI001386F7B6|nr:hypothetical protein [Candidatus Methanodesulfokores washburnensis]
MKKGLEKHIIKTEEMREITVIVNEDGNLYFLMVPSEKVLEELKKQGLEFEGRVILCG